jgi:beta-glucosidase-like glycosyl hydrolase
LLVTLLAGCSTGTGSTASPSSAAPPRTSSAPPTPPPPTGPEADVADALADLDRRAQVTQLFVVGVRLEDLGPGTALAGTGVGGIFLAGRSTAAAADLAATAEAWQSNAPGPGLWIAADQEGGQVQTLSGPGFDRLPSARVQGDLPRDELTDLARGLGRSLRGAGVNLDLAPVVDVVPAGTAAGNPPIGAFGREYGNTAEEVVAAAGTIVAGLAASRVTATIKHFPGLGRVTANTDTTATVTDTTTTADDAQVAAFGTLANLPAHPFVMTSSAYYAQLDAANPAVFSPAVVDGLLRDRLGFDGVVISDDLGHARAVAAVPPGERAVRFLAAGGTLVLTVEPADLEPMVDAVLARDAADPAFARQVDAAVHTALLAKARAGLLR